MTSKNPTITIVLPTYNRPYYLKKTIQTILNQDYPYFELLILDDASTDNTQEVVEAIQDKRISYVRNKKNLGYGQNLRNGFKFAKGKYIFLISDDDLIMQTDTVSHVIKKMESTQAGYAQLGLMYYDDDWFRPTSLDHVGEKEFYLPPSEDIILKTLNWHFGSISGNIFRKDLVKQEDLIDDVWWPYFKAIYRAILKHGCVYFGHHFIVARISTTGLIKWLDMKVNKDFYMNLLFEIYKEFDASEERLAMFKKNRLDFVLSTLVGIKYYTSNANIKSMAKEIVRNRPEYLFELDFWRPVVTALCMPKILLSILRKVRLEISKIKMKNYIKKIALEKNLTKSLQSK